jgi:hypothetical protein
VKSRMVFPWLGVLLLSAAPLLAARLDPQGPASGEAPARTPGARAGRAGPGPGRANPGRIELPPAGATVAEVEQLFDRFEIAEARKALQLNPTQFMAFRPRLQQLQKVRRQSQRERQRLVAELDQLTRRGGGPDDYVLSAKLKAVDDQAAQSARLVRDAYDQVESTLSIPQRVRFKVFEQRMEQRKLELIAQARQQVQRGTPPPLAEAGR